MVLQENNDKFYRKTNIVTPWYAHFSVRIKG